MVVYDAQLRTIRPVTLYPGSKLFTYAVEHGLLKGTADFYEQKHMNSDLVSLNFTQYPTEVIHKRLYDANVRLINRYLEVQAQSYVQICEDMYLNNNVTYRGFRQT